MATKKTTDVAADVEKEITDAQVAEVVETKDEVSTKSTAKAGKRSAKAVAEAEAKVEKEERKAAVAAGEAEEAKPKQPVKPARSRLERRSKNFRKAAEQIEKDKVYSLEEAVTLAQKTSSVKFDATVELHMRLGVDPRHADQNIRDNLVLPAGTGKSVKVAVLADVDDAAAAKKAGADIAGLDEILKDLDKGQINFDTLIATPSQMAKLGKYARVLGPRGLMPNPKSGTVTTDVAKAVAEAKAGRVEYRVDGTGIVHLGVGKVSFTPKQLVDNVQAVFTSIKSNKPNSLKGNYIKAIHLTTTMGPSIVVDLAAAN
jgi:large subunit ribosomal protein L1